MEQHSRFAALIRSHFPDVAAEHLAELPHPGWGGDSNAFLVDGALVFRFPRGPGVAEALATEVCLLPRLAPRAPLRIPDFRYVAYASREHSGTDTDPADGAPARVPLFVGYPVI